MSRRGKRKKSLVGWTYKGWKKGLHKGKKYNQIFAPTIYYGSYAKYCYRGDNVKVRITIEEL